MLQTTCQLARNAGALNGNNALGSVFAEVTHAFQITCNAQGTDDFPQVSCHWLTLGNGNDCLVANFAFRVVKNDVFGNDLLGQSRVGIDQRANRIRTHLFSNTAHLRDTACQEFQFIVISRQDMRMCRCHFKVSGFCKDARQSTNGLWPLRHNSFTLTARSYKRDQPKRPMM
ncbi:hypothetical protein D3C80_1277370 [compost metagenome]